MSILKLCLPKKNKLFKEPSRNSLIEFSFREASETNVQKSIKERPKGESFKCDIPFDILKGSKFAFDEIITQFFMTNFLII